MSTSASISVVIPVLNEARRLPALLADLAAAPSDLLREIWVVDGGSHDGSPLQARLAGARLLHCPAGRGPQLIHGVNHSEASWLLLLHADVRLPEGWWGLLRQAMTSEPTSAWTFPLAIQEAGIPLKLVALLTNLRCQLRQLPYGDQGLLLSRALYERLGGMAPLALMEDLDFVLRLRREARIRMLPCPLQVDGRRWHRLGILATAWSNGRLRRAWHRGVDPTALARIYQASTRP